MTFSSSKWLYDNRESVSKHRGEWIAYNENGIAAHGKDLKKVQDALGKEVQKFRMYLVPKNIGKVRILPIKFKTVHFGEWLPNFPVTIRNGDHQLFTDMLIDSGADSTLISYDAGLQLGLKHDPTDLIDEAQGVGGGVVKLTFKRLELEIEGVKFFAPVAWILDTNYPEMIIGREVVFDLFDIEFKQAEQQIVFKPRAKV
jgi:hypothetical protein